MFEMICVSEVISAGYMTDINSHVGLPALLHHEHRDGAWGEEHGGTAWRHCRARGCRQGDTAAAARGCAWRTLHVGHCMGCAWRTLHGVCMEDTAWGCAWGHSSSPGTAQAERLPGMLPAGAALGAKQPGKLELHYLLLCPKSKESLEKFNSLVAFLTFLQKTLQCWTRAALQGTHRSCSHKASPQPTPQQDSKREI